MVDKAMYAVYDFFGVLQFYIRYVAKTNPIRTVFVKHVKFSKRIDNKNQK